MTHVLIVDDLEESRYLLQALLQGNGYRVSVAGNGLEALAAARREAPDVVVSDALMPGMDGFALCRAWMQDATLRSIPFVFYSATYTDPKDEQFALALGAVRYLVKPQEPEAFLGELTAVLQEWAARPAPGPASPLDDTAFGALRESARSRKLESKLLQLEAMNRRLREGEQNFRQLFDANPHPMWIYDIETLAFLAVNDAAVAHYGWSREEFLAMSIADIRPPEDVTRVLTQVAQLKDKAIGEPAVWKHRKMDGSLLDVEITSHVIEFSGRRARVALAHDISERKRSEAALREREHFLSESQRIAHIGGWTWNLTGPINWTDETYRIYGVSPETFTPTVESLVNLIHPEDRPAMQRWIEACAAGEEPGELEFRAIRPDGAVHVLSGRGELIHDAGHKPAFMAGTVQDITERKRSEAALRESEARFRGLVEQSIAGIYIIQDGRIAYVNPRFAEIFGYASGDELIGVEALSIVAENDRASVAESIRQRIEGELQSLSYGFTGRRKDGSLIEVGFHSARATHRGRPAIIGLLQDITQSKRAEQNIRKLSLAIEQSPVSVVITDTEGRIEYVNPKFTEVTGYGAAEVIGQNSRLLKSGETSPESYRELWKTITSGATWRGEFHNRRKNGTLFWESASISPIIDGDGRATHYIGVKEDITARKLHEDELRRLNEELERRVEKRTHALQVANRELEAFSYSVSHDLRAPLRAISGFGQLIEDGYAAQLDAHGRDLLARVRAGAERMGHLIDDLLKLSQISRQAMHVRRVDLSAFAREVADELQAAEPGRRVDWVIAPVVTAEGDPGLLKVALHNLIGNAWKYTSRRDTARIEFGVTESQGHPEYFVRDNGAGFDMAYADKLFGAFQRLHTPAEFPGTGIGLATVARVIHRHGGEVRAEGRPGEGASFYFTL